MVIKSQRHIRIIQTHRVAAVGLLSLPILDSLSILKRQRYIPSHIAESRLMLHRVISSAAIQSRTQSVRATTMGVSMVLQIRIRDLDSITSILVRILQPTALTSYWSHRRWHRWSVSHSSSTVRIYLPPSTRQSQPSTLMPQLSMVWQESSAALSDVA